MGGRSKGPKIPKATPAPAIQPVPDIIDYIAGQETIEVQDGTGKKKRIIKGLPKELIQDVLPDAKEDPNNELGMIPILEKFDRLPEIMRNPKERKIFLKELERLKVPEANQFDHIVLGRQLIGEFTDNIQALMRLDPEGTSQAFGPQLEAFERIQTRALEKNFDMEEARQEALLAKSGLSKSTTAADLRATRYRTQLEQRQQLKDRMLLMADELKSQELSRQLQTAQEAGNITKLGVAERQQEIEAELASTQADIQGRAQEIAADQASEQLDLQEGAQQLHAQELNQNAALMNNQMDLAVGQANQNAVMQQNQERLTRRGQDQSREVNLRGMLYARSPLMQALQEFDTVNNAHLQRNAAENNAKFTRSSLQQQRFANARPSGFSNFAKGALSIGGMALGGGLIPGVSALGGDALMGGLIGSKAGGLAGDMF